VAIDDADHRDQDRRQKNAEAPEDEGMDEARPESLQQLALTEHVGQLVAHPPPRLAAARGGRAEAQQADEERGAAREQQPADRDRRGQGDRREC
jgi:hypothetical protein